MKPQKFESGANATECIRESARTLRPIGCPVSVFPAAVRSEGRTGLPTVTRLWRALTHLLLSEGRRRLPPVARPGRAPPQLLRYRSDRVKQICQRRILSILAIS